MEGRSGRRVARFLQEKLLFGRRRVLERERYVVIIVIVIDIDIDRNR